MLKRTQLIAILVGIILVPGIQMSSAASTVKYVNQKVGQTCSSNLLKKIVVLPSGSTLVCSKSGSRNLWVKSSNSAKPETPQTQVALIPEFSGTYYSTLDGITLQISNYDPLYTWAVSSNIGFAEIDSEGKITVSSFPAGTSLSLKVSTSRGNNLEGNNNITFSPLMLSPVPTADATTFKQLQNSAQFNLSNYDSDFTYTVSSSSGIATIDSSGLIRVTNLEPGASASVSVITSAKGYRDQTNAFSVQALKEFMAISQRDWQLIAKDPDGSSGKYVVVYGKITQFDASTGLNSFRADVAGADLTSNGYWFGGDNTFLSGDVNLLKALVAGDKFRAKVRVNGSYTYTSVLNGTYRVPSLQVFEIYRIG